MIEFCPTIKNRLYGGYFANFLQSNRKTSFRTFDVVHDGGCCSKDYFEADVATMIRALKSLKLKPGNLIAIATPKCYESIVTIYAADAMGLEVLILSDNFDILKIRQYLAAYKVKACLTCDFLANEAKYLFSEVSSLSTIINVELRVRHSDYFSDPIRIFVSFKNLMEKAHFYGGFIKPTVIRHAFATREILTAPKSSISFFDLVFY